MNPIRGLVRLLLFFTLATVTRATDLPRVAVVPDSPEPSVAAFADLLSVSLASASDQYTLVERAELTRLASEAEVQKLAADQRPAALAKLAKADGLIIVGADLGDPKLPKLTLHLTSTNNGLVLRSLILGGKQDEYPKAAELAAGVLRFPCERLTRGDMKPPVIVSLLGIRPAFEIDRALETTLNLAVAQQLSAQSGIAVSERWRMNDLVFERSLVGEKPQSFATGTTLLDGSYTRKGDQLEFSLRLRKAESEAGKTLTLQGPANKPTDLAQQIAKLIATESGQSGEVLAWDAVAEGRQYAALGEWQLVRNLSEESARALESAIALGSLDGLVLRKRILAYKGIVEYHPGLGYDDTRTEVDGWDKLPKHDFKRKVEAAIRSTVCAHEMLDAKFFDLGEKEYPKNSRVFDLVANFAQNMKVLQALCLRGEQLELATEARMLRRLSRELVTKCKENLVSSFGNEVVQRFYMHDTPRDAEADLLSLLEPGKISNGDSFRGEWLRNNFWQTFHDPSLWRFVDWSSTDNKIGDLAWKNFISKLRHSKSLVSRVDGLAFAFQTSRDNKEREDILNEYCSLLENRWEEVITNSGQMSFVGFAGYYDSRHWKTQRYPACEERMTRFIIRVIDSAEWVEHATIRTIASTVYSWKSLHADERKALESLAVELLNSVETYTSKAKRDPRWKARYQTPNYGRTAEELQKTPENIIREFPRLKEKRISKRPAITGAVPIHAWKPEGHGLSGSKNWMFGEMMLSSGDFLFVPMINQGIIELDVRTMSVSRVTELPISGNKFISNLTQTNDLMVITIDNRLFTRPRTGVASSWKEVILPDVKRDENLMWLVSGFADDYYVGSCLDISSKSPRMLAGLADGNKLTWLVSSNRRPAMNPLDTVDPKSTHLAYRNKAGKTMVLMGGPLSNSASLVELETGREISSLAGGGVTQIRGEMPLYWGGDNGKINFIAAFDPSREQPRMMFKTKANSKNTSIKDQETSSLYDASRPEFRGELITGIVHGSVLWLLKKEPEEPKKFQKNDPNGLRLIRASLDGGEAVEVPLRYEVPDEIRKLAKSGGQNVEISLDNPFINSRSITATPKGLFFASSGYNIPHWSAGRAWGGDLAPVLLYIAWDNINAWLAKNAPHTAKPAPEPAIPASP